MAAGGAWVASGAELRQANRRDLSETAPEHGTRTPRPHPAAGARGARAADGDGRHRGAGGARRAARARPAPTYSTARAWWPSDAERPLEAPRSCSARGRATSRRRPGRRALRAAARRSSRARPTCTARWAWRSPSGRVYCGTEQAAAPSGRGRVDVSGADLVPARPAGARVRSRRASARDPLSRMNALSRATPVAAGASSAPGGRLRGPRRRTADARRSGCRTRPHGTSFVILDHRGTARRASPGRRAAGARARTSRPLVTTVLSRRQGTAE